nr:hypothetical protein [Tanacetum cinerariifolium]
NADLTALAGERAEAEGRANQLEADLKTAIADATAERQAAEHARTELAKALLRLEAMPRLEEDLERARSELEQERVGRVTAEREAAVLTSEKAALQSQASAAQA